MKKLRYILIVLALVIVGAGFYALASFNNHVTVVTPVGDFDVLVADNFLEHQKGLSGTRMETLGADGMLFVFDQQLERAFWMKGMNYDLDIVWIRDGKVMKIETGIPAPQPGEDPQKMYSRPFEVDMVLELPSGTIARTGLTEGHLIEVQK